MLKMNIIQSQNIIKCESCNSFEIVEIQSDFICRECGLVKRECVQRDHFEAFEPIFYNNNNTILGNSKIHINHTGTDTHFNIVLEELHSILDLTNGDLDTILHTHKQLGLSARGINSKHLISGIILKIFPKFTIETLMSKLDLTERNIRKYTDLVVVEEKRKTKLICAFVQLCCKLGLERRQYWKIAHIMQKYEYVHFADRVICGSLVIINFKYDIKHIAKLIGTCSPTLKKCIKYITEL